MSRRSEQDDGFDFLLDTMTNAFGGVLFLAILISIQLQDRTVAKKNAEAPTRKVVRTKKEIASCEVEITELKTLLKQQESRRAKIRSRDDYQDMIRLEDVVATLRQRLQDVSDKKTDVVQRIENAASSGSDVIRLRGELKRKQSALEYAKQERTIKGELPKLMRTGKKEQQLVLRYGKLYSLFDRKGDFNTQDFFLSSEADRVHLRPKPYRGFDLSSEEPADLWDAIPARIEEHYLAIVIWEDSFESFTRLKPELVKRRFPYTLYLRRIGETAVSGGSGGSAVIPGA